MSGTEGSMKNNTVGLERVDVWVLVEGRWLSAGRREQSVKVRGSWTGGGRALLASSLGTELQKTEVTSPGSHNQMLAEPGHCSGLKIITCTTYCPCLRGSPCWVLPRSARVHAPSTGRGAGGLLPKAGERGEMESRMKTQFVYSSFRKSRRLFVHFHSGDEHMQMFAELQTSRWANVKFRARKCHLYILVYVKAVVVFSHGIFRNRNGNFVSCRNLVLLLAC